MDNLDGIWLISRWAHFVARSLSGHSPIYMCRAYNFSDMSLLHNDTPGRRRACETRFLSCRSILLFRAIRWHGHAQPLTGTED